MNGQAFAVATGRIDGLLEAQADVTRCREREDHMALGKSIVELYQRKAALLDFIDQLLRMEHENVTKTDPRAGLRRCEVGPIDDPLPGWFHAFTERGDAIVEFPQGHVVAVMGMVDYCCRFIHQFVASCDYLEE